MSTVTINTKTDQLSKHDHLLNQTNIQTNGNLSDENHHLTKSEENSLTLQNEVNTNPCKESNQSRPEENLITEQTEVIPVKDLNRQSDNIQVQTQIIKRIDTVKTEVIITKREEHLTIQDYNQRADQSNGNIITNNQVIINEINDQSNVSSSTTANIEEESVKNIERNTTAASSPIKPTTPQDNLLTDNRSVSDSTIIPIQENQHHQADDSNISLNDRSIHQTTEVKETISTTTQEISQSQLKTELSDDPTDLSDLKDCQFNSPRLRKLVEEIVGEIPKKPAKEDVQSSPNSQTSAKKSMRDIVLERKELILRTRAIKSAAKSPDGEGKREKPVTTPEECVDDSTNLNDDSETSPLYDSHGRQTFHELLRNIAPKTKMALGLNKHVDDVKTILLRGGKLGYGMVLAENEDKKVYISHITSSGLASRSPLKVGDIVYSINNTVLDSEKTGNEVLARCNNSLICVAVKTDERIEIDPTSTLDSNQTPITKQPILVKTDPPKPLSKKKSYNRLFSKNKFVEPLVVSTSGGVANRAIIQGWEEFIQLARAAKLRRYVDEGWILDNDERNFLSNTIEEKEDDANNLQSEEVSQVKVSDDVRSLLTSASWQENRKNKMQQSEKNDTVDGIQDVVETNVEVNVTMMTSIKVFKVVLLGDSGVGKSSFINRFCHHNFEQYHTVTIDPGLHNKPVVVDDTVVMLEIWDTAGQERFNSLPRAYFRQADAAIVLFDIANKSSFDNIPSWLLKAEEMIQKPVLLMVIGNKLDMLDQRQINKEQGFKLAFEHNAMYAETSAKTGQHVFETCHQLTRHLFEASNETHERNPSTTADNSIKIDNADQRILRRGRCC